MKALISMNRLINTTLTASLVCAASQLWAADYSNADFQDAYQEYMTVSAGEGGSAKQLAKTWEHLYLADQKDPMALVMLGSSHTLMGRDAWMPWTKLRHTETGLEEMAIAQRLLTAEHKQIYFDNLTVDLQVKTTAAITFTQVPEMFGRHEEGFYLFEDVLSDPALAKVPAPAVTYIYYYAISAALQIGKNEQAVAWQNELIELSVDDEYTQAALKLES
jgi:hypothetical protein